MIRLQLPILSLLLVPSFLIGQEPPAPPVQPAPQATAKTNPVVVIETSLGSIEAELFPAAAPETVKNFIGLAEGTKEWTDKRAGEKVKRPFYDGLIFHRVIKNFMLQCGCPNGDGSGGPGYQFADEFNFGKLGLDEQMVADDKGRPSKLAGKEVQACVSKIAKELGIDNQQDFNARKQEVIARLQKMPITELLLTTGRKDNRKLPSCHAPKRGVLAMANSGPNTNGSQFFINLVDTPWLTGRHTVFGRVTKGMDIVDKIGAVPVTPGSQPLEPVTIKTIRLLQEKPAAKDAAPDPYADETKAERDERMGWWRDARFGMFIHWGVYAVPAGTYDGKQIPGIGEWIMLRGKIPVAEYRAFAKQFNPVKYDAEAWAALAEEAGMKYMVITSKHHDGFALFDSKVTDWDIVDATPYGKDLLRPLVTAVKKRGLKMGFYYSQAQDWTHPGGAKSGRKEGQGWDEAHRGDFDAYLKDIAYPQVREILSGYDLDVLWWDTPHWMNKERAELLLPLLRLRPGIITNNRLGGGYKGDTDTPEQRIPATGIDGRDWETCMTMNRTWGFKSYDHDWKSTETLVRNLIDIASKGGNYLLNVGPTAEGLIPEASIVRLKEIGQWMKGNGAAIHGTTASPFAKLTWGRCTKKVRDDGATLYLHVFDWPQDGRLVVPGLRNEVTGARLLVSGAAVAAEVTADGVLLRLPAEAPDPMASVIALEVKGALQIEKVLPRPGADGVLVLGAELADLHNPGYGEHAKVETKAGRANIGFWHDARAWLEWSFQIDAPGTYEAVATIATPSASSAVTVAVGDQLQKLAVKQTGDYGRYETMAIGRFEFGRAGKHTLTLRPQRKGWQPINLRALRLRPVR